jgi:Rha family phage regulatory protein
MNALIPVVYLNAGVALTDSKKVADFFEKEHKDVLKALTNLQEEIGRGRRNFAPSSDPSTWFVPTSYINSQNREMPMYEMTKDGFTLLAMGFTGPAALQFKLAYIAEFNRKAADHHEAFQLLVRRIETKFPLFKSFKEDYIVRALPMPDLCAKYAMSPDAIRRMGHAMLREGYVDEAKLVVTRRGAAAWNAIVAKRSQLSLPLESEVV